LNRAVGAVVERNVESEPSDLDGLDPGETHALHVARSLGGTIATDDGAARRRAAALGVSVTGSLRVPVLAIERDVLAVEEADKKLDRWIEEGDYRSPTDSITDLL
jgi:predicted nucleic acid-binding protein